MVRTLRKSKAGLFKWQDTSTTHLLGNPSCSIALANHQRKADGQRRLGKISIMTDRSLRLRLKVLSSYRNSKLLFL